MRRVTDLNKVAFEWTDINRGSKRLMKVKTKRGVEHFIPMLPKNGDLFIKYHGMGYVFNLTDGVYDEEEKLLLWKSFEIFQPNGQIFFRVYNKDFVVSY